LIDPILISRSLTNLVSLGLLGLFSDIHPPRNPLMGKPNKRHRAKGRAHRLNVVVPYTINCAYWNCNGLIRDNKQDMIVDVMNDYNLHVLAVSETHLRHGSNDDLSCLDKFIWYSKERLWKEKKGGGMLTIVQPGLNHSRYEPPLPIHENNSNVALCFVYLAAEVGGDSFQVWNAELCAMLQAEITTLREDGYTCSIAGDFNGHIGADSQGIPGNNRDINSNGRLIRDFISNNDLRIVNSDVNRCKGLFTRITNNSVSALDLVLEDDKDVPLVTEMSIDTFGEILGGSDHSAIFYKLKVNSGPFTKEPQEEGPIVGPSQATGEAYREAFESLMLLADWSPMDTEEKCRFLQDTLVSAAKISCNQKPVRKTHVSVCKSVRRLRKKCIVAEAQVRQLEHEKAVLGFGSDAAEKEKVELLQFFKQEAVTLRLQIKEKARQRLLLRRLHARSTLTNKQFWRLVRRTVKKKGILSAVKDTQGKLATDRAWIEEIVLEELAKIFSGQRSAIFTHRGEQLIKEMDVKQLMGWQELMKDTVGSTTHEGQVCRRTTEAEVKAVIDKMKLQRSPGVDNVTVAMLKYAGPCFVSMLTDVINATFHEGKVPESLLVGRMTLIDKKSPSLLVSSKRPLTVSCVFLSVITKSCMEGWTKYVRGMVTMVQCSMGLGQGAQQQTVCLCCWQRSERRRGKVIQCL